MYLHNMANYPDCVLKYEKKWTLVQKKRDDLYYLYRVHSHWNRHMKGVTAHNGRVSWKDNDVHPLFIGQL